MSHEAKLNSFIHKSLNQVKNCKFLSFSLQNNFTLQNILRHTIIFTRFMYREFIGCSSNKQEFYTNTILELFLRTMEEMSVEN